jgi:hypothetical protein
MFIFFSPFLRLVAVCWLDVNATLIGVPKGRYDVFWRLKATRYLPADLEFGCSSLDNVRFNAC